MRTGTGMHSSDGGARGAPPRSPSRPEGRAAPGGADGADVAALVERSARLRALGRRQEARAACLEALRVAPADDAALHLLGLIEVELGHLNVAERVLRRAVALRPLCAPYAHALAGVLARREEHAEALLHYGRAIELDPAPAEPWQDRGRLLRTLHRWSEAESDLREAARRAPDRPQALDELGLLLVDAQRSDEAVTCFERAIRAEPGYAPAHDHLGAIHLARGRVAQAMRCFENALHHDPALASAADHLGQALLEQCRCAEAAEQHERACALAPGSAPFAVRRASAWHALGRDEEAEAGYRALLARDAGLADARTGLAELMDWRGEYQDGLALLEPVTAAPDAPPEARMLHARLLGRVYRVSEALAVLEPLAGEEAARRLSVAQARALAFAQGHLYDHGGQQARAWACFERGNRMRRAGFDPDALAAQVEATLEACAAPALARLARAAQPAPELLFLVGLPHSATTLVEQVLASQPQVLASRATVTLAGVAQGLAVHGQRPYPRCLAQLDRAALGAAAGRYRATLPPHGPEVRFVTRRVPVDFLHLGLIELMFPRARIVHCTRDELDTALSSFADGSVDPALGYGASLRGIAAFTLAHRRLMAHWRAVLRTPVYELDYEALVTEPERETRGLAAFLGLAWNEHYLRFHETSRAPALCHARVRRPFYTSSIGRHRRYARELAPLRELLRLP